MNPPVVISVCGDPGGAAAVAPVVARLRSDERVRVVSYVYNEAVDVFRSRSIPAESLADTVDVGWARSCLTRKGSSLVLAATSDNGLDFEKPFIAAAKRLGTPSVVVLDFWSNLEARFRDPAGAGLCLPDLIAVMDARAAEELTALGVPPSNLRVTGQPAFDDLLACRRRFSNEDRQAMRRSLGVGDDDILLLFASQPLRTTADSLGYDETVVLTAVVESLEQLQRSYRRRIVLLIRPHPREPSDRFSELHSDEIRLVASKEADARRWAMACDAVIGMNSVLLVEACYLGCLVASIQPGLRSPNSLPSDIARASIGVFRHEHILPALEALLFDFRTQGELATQVAALHADLDSARRVADCVYSAILGDASP